MNKRLAPLPLVTVVDTAIEPEEKLTTIEAIEGPSPKPSARPSAADLMPSESRPGGDPEAFINSGRQSSVSSLEITKIDNHSSARACKFGLVCLNVVANSFPPAAEETTEVPQEVQARVLNPVLMHTLVPLLDCATSVVPLVFHSKYGRTSWPLPQLNADIILSELLSTLPSLVTVRAFMVNQTYKGISW